MASEMPHNVWGEASLITPLGGHSITAGSIYLFVCVTFDSILLFFWQSFVVHRNLRMGVLELSLSKAMIWKGYSQGRELSTLLWRI